VEIKLSELPEETEEAVEEVKEEPVAEVKPKKRATKKKSE
jgi:hypothetical protein